jgi:hypothetical protein
MLETIAQDENVKMTQRLRALEEISRIEARLAAGAASPLEQSADEMAPDPMADLDAMEAERQDELAAARARRQRRASS